MLNSGPRMSRSDRQIVGERVGVTVGEGVDGRFGHCKKVLFLSATSPLAVGYCDSSVSGCWVPPG